jgi:DNA-binding CsgD family transcriptional regulator
MIARGQYEKLVRVLPELYSARTLDSFPQHAIGVLPQLIAVDSCGYNETNFARRRFETFATPSLGARVPDADEALARLMHRHPMVVHNRKTDQRALKMSDLLSQRQFRRSELYDVVYRAARVEYLMTGGFEVPPAGDIVTMALGREATDFSEDDRDLLNLLRPHLRQAYANADAMTTFQAQLEGREQLLEEAVSSAVVVVAHGRSIKHASQAATRWLASFFPNDKGRNGELPDLLQRSIRFWQNALDGKHSNLKPCSPLMVEAEDSRLNIRLLRTGQNGEIFLLLQREASRDCPELLEQRLGLLPREAEVLLWISRGKTSREIAAIMSITRRTVDKHVERIHRKLGTETRTAAAAIAWSATRDS